MPPADLQTIKRNTQLIVWIVDSLVHAFVPGTTTRQLDAAIERQIQRQGARSLYKGYNDYPASASLGVNDIVSYAIPDDRPLADGDLLHLQIAIEKDGTCATLERTFPIGILSGQRRQLWLAAKLTLNELLQKLTPGMLISDISQTVEEAAVRARTTIVREWLSHGVGTDTLIDQPDIPHYRTPRRGPPLKEGTLLQLRPLLTTGNGRLTADPQTGAVRTADGADAVLMGHTIALEHDTPSILSFGPWDTTIYEESPEMSIMILGADQHIFALPVENIGLHQLITPDQQVQLMVAPQIVRHGRYGADTATIAAFETILNSDDLTLYDIQLFLENHPDFLPDSPYNAMRSSIGLPQYLRNSDLPDLIYEPIANQHFDPVAHGMPFKPFTVDNIPKGRQAFYLHAACTQIRQFLPFYNGNRYLDALRQTTGIRTELPCLTATIGKAMPQTPLTQKQLQDHLPWVCTMTTEKLQQKLRHRLRIN